MLYLNADIKFAPTLLMHKIWGCGAVPSRHSKTIVQRELHLQRAWLLGL